MKPLWPEAVSDGLSLSCHDCGDTPRFDYRVTDGFWRRWVPGDERLSVVCLPCLDKRCGGSGLHEALEEVQWVGTGYTVVLEPRCAVSHETRKTATRVEPMPRWKIEALVDSLRSSPERARSFIRAVCADRDGIMDSARITAEQLGNAAASLDLCAEVLQTLLGIEDRLDS